MLTLSAQVPPVALQITASLILLDSVYLLPLLNICALLRWHRRVFCTRFWILTAEMTYVLAITTVLSRLWLHCRGGPVTLWSYLGSALFPISINI